ncbi:hypothetical protein [Chryseobacterium sp. Leaf394]|uniref:hypothetical protein n=1 Tax=Chryseobacterium sp. Leaf394 TaxID=1736361 RepID=UPI0006F6D422|nr:hypothetical protein [Chryseobacterium sp. Leaf394]KQS91787.1 hypothetical protein ASG21_04830 [Chryseobacterium sp. Leaf394]
MISRDEYLKSLEIILKYREQCKNDLKQIAQVQSEVTLFKDSASPRLYNIVKKSLISIWNHELTVNEIRLAVDEVGIDSFSKIRGMGNILFKELKKILYNA